MEISVSDIHSAYDFAEHLKQSTESMLHGEPRSRALVREGISISVFNSLIKSLHRSTTDESDAGEFLHPAWQDELTHDITWDEYYYLPPDFEEGLEQIMKRALTGEEAEVVRLMYMEQASAEEAAEKLGVSVPTVRSRKKSALSKLRKYKNELIAGKELLTHLDEARAQQKAHRQSLTWMRDVLSYFSQLGDDESSPVEDMPVSSEAIAYYQRNGLETVADVCGYSLAELFTDVTDAHFSRRTEREEEPGDTDDMLGAVRQSASLSLDSPLDESMGLDNRTSHAFADAGIHTVREFLGLSEDELYSIRGIGERTIVYIYRRVMFG